MEGNIEGYSNNIDYTNLASLFIGEVKDQHILDLYWEIQTQTYLNVADNSGARKLMCIWVLGASNWKYAHIGDVIIAVLRKQDRICLSKNQK
jgi:hypothetical protein